MNVFTTDHPMTYQPPMTPRWLRRLLFAVFVYYPLYLALLGPFWALDGRGYLKFVTDPMREIIYTPAGLVTLTPFTEMFFDAYLDCWYVDPNAPDAPP